MKGLPSNVINAKIPKTSKIKILQLKLSNHRFNVEIGSWARPKIPRNDQVCLVCNTIEDEAHVILFCPLYLTLRTHYLNIYFWDTPSLCKYVELINHTNPRVLNNLANLYGKIVELRSQIFNI